MLLLVLLYNLMVMYLIIVSLFEMLIITSLGVYLIMEILLQLIDGV